MKNDESLKQKSLNYERLKLLFAIRVVREGGAGTRFRFVSAGRWFGK